MLFDKLREEMAELAGELFPGGKIPQVAATVEAQVVPDAPIDDPHRQSRVEDELGDILFVIANIARRWKINPEEALRRSNAKFERRFRYIEAATCLPAPHAGRRHPRRDGRAVSTGEAARSANPSIAHAGRPIPTRKCDQTPVMVMVTVAALTDVSPKLSLTV